VTDALAPHGGTVRTFVMDEARLGQQGTLTRVWARTGSRPTSVKQTKYEWVYLYAAVEPASGASVALLARRTSTRGRSTCSCGCCRRSWGPASTRC
jgi:hypothetical protein